MNLARTNLSNVINNRNFFLIEYLHLVEIAVAVIFSRLSLLLAKQIIIERKMYEHEHIVALNG